jgi:hypothetical protein
LLVEEDDPEKRVAELERRLAEVAPASGQQHTAEPPPQFSDTQPIPIPGAFAGPQAHGVTPDARARRNARFRAHARTMYPQIRRQQARRKLIGWIIGVLSVAAGLWTLALALSVLVFPSTTLWMTGIVCDSPYHLEHYKIGPASDWSVKFRCVNGQSSYSAMDSVVAIQALVIALVVAVLTVVAIAILVWLLRKRSQPRT